MSIIRCVPCMCIPGNISNNKFKQDVEVILCTILNTITFSDSFNVSASKSLRRDARQKRQENSVGNKGRL